MHAQRILRLPRHMLVGAVAALAAAALHLGVVTFSRDVLGRFSWLWSSRDVVWMVPLGYLAVYAVISTALGLLAVLLRNGVSVRGTTWVWATVTSFAVLLLFPRIHGVAWLALALGIGFHVARVAARRPDVTRRVVTRAGIALTIMFALLITVVEGRRAVVARRAMAARPSASSETLNVVLIVWDTARAQNMSLYGYERPTTPFLDSLARQAAVFDRAFATAPWTLPSHASIFTGQYATAQSGDRLSPMDRTHRTLAEELRDHGYDTGGFVANYWYTTYATGLHRGFIRYEDTQRTLAEVFLNTTLTQSSSLLIAYDRVRRERWYGEAARALLRFNWRPFRGKFQWHAPRSAVDVTDRFLRWQGRTTRPFFAFLNYMEAHDPERAPARDQFNGGATRLDQYDGALFSLDNELERLVRALESRGELARTIIVVTADHGEHFGEHGLTRHGNSLYLNLLHVPLVILAPQHEVAGTRISRVVSLRDLPATILGLVGIVETLLPGAMLLPRDSAARASFSSSPAIAEVSVGINARPLDPTFYGDLAAVVGDSLHVIRDGTGAHHVFAYRRDRDEQDDLARDPRIVAWARARMDSVVRAFGLRPPNVAAARARSRGSP